jgi:CRISPR-associated protein Csm1
MEEREINYLGALLHDIGKFKWRSQDIKAGDDHEKLGEEFIREYLGKVDCLKVDIEQIIAAANRQKGKIWQADVTAAQEREDSTDKAPRRYLESIANRVSISKLKNKSDNYWFYKPAPISLKSVSSLFPRDSNKKLSEYDLSKEEYLKLHEEYWNEFVSEIHWLNGIKNSKVFINTFYNLLEKYTSNVLSAGYLSHPDVSLFDHSRITAALSICIEEGVENNECLLIQGDVSGIQSYIYDGIHEATRVAKRLRGRSFFVSLLTDVIFEYTLNKLNLYSPNLIYNGGGHFIMIAPNNTEIKDILKQLETEVNQRLHHKFAGRIGFVLGGVEVGAGQLVNNFEKCFQKLGREMGDKKNCRAFENLENILNDSVEAESIREREEEISDKETEIGQVIPKLTYICKVSGSKQEISSQKPMINFSEFGTSIFLCKDVSEVENVISRNTDTEVTILKVNDTDFLREFERQIFSQASKGFKLIGNYIPMNKDNIPLTFEEIAELNSTNYPLLGILRMDVDSLGAIFSLGLKSESGEENKYTPSRVASLSRVLNSFFSGRINDLAKQNSVYLAYSGGDDVFAVGSWINIMHFSLQVRKEFAELCCGNENLSISAGIVLTKSNFPISVSARLAGEQEHKAKTTHPIAMKDRVCIFDIQLTWDEFRDYLTWAENLSEVLNSESDTSTKKDIPRSFVHSLLNLTKKSFVDDGKLNLIEFTKSNTKILYQFARRKVTNEIVEKELKGKLNEHLRDLALKFLKSDNKKDFYRKFQFPASIILFKTRRS